MNSAESVGNTQRRQGSHPLASLLYFLGQLAIIAASLPALYANAQGARAYEPGTPPWVPVIDECMTAGGQRNDCIKALPPDLYAKFREWEQNNAARRRALLRQPRIPQVPSAEELPEMYRSPLSVSELPADIATALEKEGCRIPRPLSGKSNVVTGQLAAAGQQDVALICSKDGESHIEIFWGGPASCPPLNDVRADWGLLYNTVEWEYYWVLAVASPADIRRYYERYPEECPTENLLPLEHDALEDIMAEKGSVNMYCHEGQWHRLCGAD